MNEAAGNVDYLCSEYLTEMSVVATIADLAVKEAEKPPPPRATPPTPQEDSPPPRMGVIPLGFGPDVPLPTGWREALIPFDWSIEPMEHCIFYEYQKRSFNFLGPQQTN